MDVKDILQRPQGYYSLPVSDDAGHEGPSERHLAATTSSSTSASSSSSIVQRREANRLAAHRFRNRQRSYRDSLEEKIKALEEERQLYGRRQQQTSTTNHDPSNRALPATSQPSRRRQHGSGAGARAVARAGALALEPSQSRQLSEANIRVATLEASNLSMTNELRSTSEEIDRLQRELDRWVDWYKELRISGFKRGGPVF